MYIPDLNDKIVDLINSAINVNDQKVKVAISPSGKPPPSQLIPFIGVGTGTVTTHPTDGSLTYIIRVGLTATIRVRPAKTIDYGDKYHELISYMQTAHHSITNKSALMTLLKSRLETYGFGVGGYFFVDDFNLTPRLVGPEWFSSNDESHGDRYIGYVLTSTIRYPRIIQSLSCPT